MKTDNLITALAADAPIRSISMKATWILALLVSIAVAAMVFFATLGLRPDIATAVTSVRFLFKFLVTITLAGAAILVIDQLARPGAFRPQMWLVLLVAPALLGAAVLLELAAQPQQMWPALLIGRNSLVCLTYIPLIGIGPLALILLVLRRAAPTRPGISGLVAGILAGGIAATLYAAQCIDDSPLFVATWYPLAIAILAVIGGIAGRVLARW